MPLIDINRFELFALLAILSSVLVYTTYLWSIYQKKTRPHIFSWFNWGLLSAIGAYAQLEIGGGPSAWVVVTIAVVCFFITFLAYFIGEKNITKSDWLTFIGALLAIPAWLIAEDPFIVLIIVVTISILTYYPTIRKSWRDPWGEPPQTYFWAGLRFFLTLFAVPDASAETLFYPFFLMSTEWGFAIYILWRRRKLMQQTANIKAI